MDETDNDSTAPLYTLGVASDLSGTAVHSIRQYVDRGLILPFKKENNRHLFSKVDVVRLRCIRKYIDEFGLNIAGIKAIHSLVPCWIIKPCSKKERIECDAFYSTSSPCWEVSRKGYICRSSDCRSCSVYRIPETCENMKNFLKDLYSGQK